MSVSEFLLAFALSVYFGVYALFGYIETFPMEESAPQTKQTEDAQLQSQNRAEDLPALQEKVEKPSDTQEVTVEQSSLPPVVEEDSITVPSSPPQDLTPLPVNFASINENVREALVNVLCTTSGRTTLRGISGSGIFIDEEGVVLTNAHIAQFQLLSEHWGGDDIECVLRVGSPAQRMYKVELVHISPSWINENAQKISQEAPSGTGQYDFALLRVTEPIDKKDQLPNAFSTVIPAPTGALALSEQVLVAAYPAGFLGNTSLEKSLYQTSTITEVMKLFSFTGEFVDLISVGGSVVAQKGSSGGAVANAKGELVGLVVTSTDAETTAERDLRAITLSHIDHSLREELGVGIEGLLESNHKAVAAAFRAAIAPTLAQLLIQELE